MRDFCVDRRKREKRGCVDIGGGSIEMRKRKRVGREKKENEIGEKGGQHKRRDNTCGIGR